MRTTTVSRSDRVDPLASACRDDAQEAPGTARTTLGDLLRLPSAAAAVPRVLCGEQLMTRGIRGVRVIELAYAHGALHPGDLAAIRGTGLPAADGEIAQYVDQLAEQQVAAVAVELSRQFPLVPAAMVVACRRRGLPVIAFDAEGSLGPFADEARGAVLGGRIQLMEATLAAHERFTELTLAEASAQEVVAAAAELAGAQAVYANMLHQAIAVDARHGSAQELVERWQRESFAPIGSLGVEIDEVKGTVIAPVVARGRQRGWLTIFSEVAPTAVHAMVAERAATALAIRVRSESDDALVANANRSLLADIIAGRFTAVEAMHVRAESLGHRTRGRRMLPVAMKWGHDAVDEVVRRALADARLEGIVGEVGDEGWGILVLLQPGSERRVAQFASRVHQLCDTQAAERPVLARGPAVLHYSDVGRAFAEAFEVAAVAEAGALPAAVRESDCYSIGDVRLRGLLCILGDDPRVQSFAVRTLNPLLVRDAREGGDWVSTLGTYLRLRGNKSLAAQRLGISRQTLYERLARIESLLGVQVDDPETSASLFAAIMVVESDGMARTST